MNKLIKNYFLCLIASCLFFFIVDTIYPKSVYSDLDYLQTLFSSSHSVRYYIFIFLFGNLIFINNYLLRKIRFNKFTNIAIFIIFNFSIQNLFLIAFRVTNLSTLLLLCFNFIFYFALEKGSKIWSINSSI